MGLRHILGRLAAATGSGQTPEPPIFRKLFMVEMIEVLANTLKGEITRLKRGIEELEETVARLDSAYTVYGPIKYGEYRSWLNNST